MDYQVCVLFVIMCSLSVCPTHSISSSRGPNLLPIQELKPEDQILIVDEDERIFDGFGQEVLGFQSSYFLQPAIVKSNSSVISVLDQNGLPMGLLPSSVQNFSVSDDGRFEVHLNFSCYAKFDYQVYYAQTITGKINYGTISDLSGIQAKELFIWVPVTGIHVDVPSSGYIYFEVGPISKRLSLTQFEQIPACKSSTMESRSFSRSFLR